MRGDSVHILLAAALVSAPTTADLYRRLQGAESELEEAGAPWTPGRGRCP